MKEVELNFYGYTWEEYAFQISSLQGIFIIYRGRLDAEGFVELNQVLYIGYHKGIIELYDQKVFESIRQFVAPSERIFISYAEVHSDEVGNDLTSLINMEVSPLHMDKELRKVSNYKLICNGNCELIPKEITC